MSPLPFSTALVSRLISQSSLSPSFEHYSTMDLQQTEQKQQQQQQQQRLPVSFWNIVSARASEQMWLPSSSSFTAPLNNCLTRCG
ncbi:hypothetical protein V1517DRAFT_338022 [Lipomyces orientalis]|uniref:Uncharacterized protein n=1 Tax=Lipomyces orientalis TaxID=1233043 RepID=A0ACC3TPY2_9ASCO